jgi:hypothetical protein
MDTLTHERSIVDGDESRRRRMRRIGEIDDVGAATVVVGTAG